MTKTSEVWERSDGWAVHIVRFGDVIMDISRLPSNGIINSPFDLNYTNVVTVLRAHGYRNLDGE